MKIQFVSDLHLEFNENRLYLAKNPLPVEGDVLLIAGDHKKKMLDRDWVARSASAPAWQLFHCVYRSKGQF